MYTVSVGIDAGSQCLKAVVLYGGVIIGEHMLPIGTNAIEQMGFVCVTNAIEKAGISKDAIECVTATGVGREFIGFANKTVSEVLCTVSGVDWMSLPTDIVLDMGADKTTVIKYSQGKPTKVLRNDRCASGTGRFLDIAAKPLALTADELGELSLKSTKQLIMNSTCAVFAESEVISLIHKKERPEDIARSIFDSMASRVHALLLKIGAEGNIAMIGGLAKNRGMVKAIEDVTGLHVLITQAADPQMVTALGASLIGREQPTG